MKICEHCGVYAIESDTGICHKCHGIGIRKSNTAEENQAVVDKTVRRFQRDLGKLWLLNGADDEPPFEQTAIDYGKPVSEMQARIERYEAALTDIATPHKWHGCCKWCGANLEKRDRPAPTPTIAANREHSAECPTVLAREALGGDA